MTALALDSTGSLALPLRVVRGVESCRVQVYERLRLIAGTWPTDVARGLPWPVWTGETGRKGPPSLAVRATIRRQLEEVSCVRSVLSLTVRRDGYALRVRGTLAVEDDGEAGTLDLETVSDPFATTGAPPWYIVTSGISRPPVGPAGRR